MFHANSQNGIMSINLLVSKILTSSSFGPSFYSNYNLCVEPNLMEVMEITKDVFCQFAGLCISTACKCFIKNFWWTATGALFCMKNYTINHKTLSPHFIVITVLLWCSTWRFFFFIDCITGTNYYWYDNSLSYCMFLSLILFCLSNNSDNNSWIKVVMSLILMCPHWESWLAG